MERRIEDRTVAVGLGEVRIEVLGQSEETGAGAGQGNSLRGRVVEVSGSGARLLCDAPIRPGSAVKLQWEDELWLAEAVHSRESDGKWSVGLKVRQRLTRLAELRKLMAGLAGGSPTGCQVPHSRTSPAPSSGVPCRPLVGAHS